MSVDGLNPRMVPREHVGILIPVHMGSTRFPGKALAPLWGRPLCWWPYRHAELSGAAGLVSFVTDSQEVAAWASQEGLRCCLLPSDAFTGSDRLAAVLEHPGANLGHLEIVLGLQCDEPDIRPKEIGRLIDYVREHKAVMVATYSAAWPLINFDTLRHAGLDPNEVKVIVNHRDQAIYFSRMPIATATVARKHVGLYCWRRRALESFGHYPRSDAEVAESLEQLRLLDQGVPIHVLHLPRPVHSVNTPEDLKCLDLLPAPTRVP